MKKIEFLTVKDLQEILHIGKSKAYELCKLKGFPVIKIGSKKLIYKKDVIFMKEQCASMILELKYLLLEKRNEVNINKD